MDSRPRCLTIDCQHGELIGWFSALRVHRRGLVLAWAAPFHFVTVPELESQEIKDISGLVTYGWGIVPVKARIGHTDWKTALWEKNGRYVLPLKDAVRNAETLELGETITVQIDVSFGEPE